MFFLSNYVQAPSEECPQRIEPEDKPVNSAPKASTDRHIPRKPSKPVTITSPELQAIEAMLAGQDCDLAAAFAALSHHADASLAVRTDRLSEIDEACVNRRASAPELFALTRC